jgi:hypothetical protein
MVNNQWPVKGPAEMRGLFSYAAMSLKTVVSVQWISAQVKNLKARRNAGAFFRHESRRISEVRGTGVLACAGP